MCRYISRPAISEQRLSMTQHGKVRYELKTRYRDGTTHVFFEPIDFIGKLAALIPPPKLNLTRFFGVFAPNSNLRAQVTASQRGKNSPKFVDKEHQSDKPYHARSMTWAMRPVTGEWQRVFNIDITECEKCQKHDVFIIACITEPAIIHKILSYLDKLGSPISANNTRAPPLEALEQPGKHLVEKVPKNQRICPTKSRKPCIIYKSIGKFSLCEITISSVGSNYLTAAIGSS